MVKQSVHSSVIAASVAAHHLSPNGLVVFTGAAAAVKGTPGMIGYGLAKAAVHQLTRSLAEPASGLPAGAVALAILPITLDTPANRKWAGADTDFGTWTPLDALSAYAMRSKGARRGGDDRMLTTRRRSRRCAGRVLQQAAGLGPGPEPPDVRLARQGRDSRWSDDVHGAPVKARVPAHPRRLRVRLVPVPPPPQLSALARPKVGSQRTGTRCKCGA